MDETGDQMGVQRKLERIIPGSRFLDSQPAKYNQPCLMEMSMVWASAMGLPLSLEGDRHVLKLDKQKLTEGKDLIKYFCQPCAPHEIQRSEHQETPHHAPDKWSAFKKYNIRDVKREMSIQEKLAGFRCRIASGTNTTSTRRSMTEALRWI